MRISSPRCCSAPFLPSIRCIAPLAAVRPAYAQPLEPFRIQQRAAVVSLRDPGLFFAVTSNADHGTTTVSSGAPVNEGSQDALGLALSRLRRDDGTGSGARHEGIRLSIATGSRDGLLGKLGLQNTAKLEGVCCPECRLVRLYAEEDE